MEGKEILLGECRLELRIIMEEGAVFEAVIQADELSVTQQIRTENVWASSNGEIHTLERNLVLGLKGVAPFAARINGKDYPSGLRI